LNSAKKAETFVNNANRCKG